MLIGRCHKCGKIKHLTRHSKVGHHQPPFVMICRSCHDEIHGICQKHSTNKKYQPGTYKFQKKKQ